MPAQPNPGDPADTPIETPHTLRSLESDIASVYLARLEGLFEPGALGLHDGPPHEGSVLSRIGKPEFWTCALCKKDQRRYTAAVQFYLEELFDGQAPMTFLDYCRVWGQSFYAARYDLSSARDILLLFLDQNLHYLKRLYILEQAHNQDLAPDREALQDCFDSPSNAMLFVGDHFARWVLEDWLPFHLRCVCCREFVVRDETVGCACPLGASGAAPAGCLCQ